MKKATPPTETAPAEANVNFKEIPAEEVWEDDELIKKYKEDQKLVGNMLADTWVRICTFYSEDLLSESCFHQLIAPIQSFVEKDAATSLQDGFYDGILYAEQKINETIKALQKKQEVMTKF
jgi:hypothetical protein